MKNKQSSHNILILLVLVSFGFFGSLSHLFSLALIILTFSNFIQFHVKNELTYKAYILFFSLTSCFFVNFFTGFDHNDISSLLISLSPMLPIPFIGLLIVFNKNTNFKITSKKLAQFSQISVLFAALIVLIFTLFTDPETIYYNSSNRLNLFSGNPIPFSFVMVGVSIFCLANWRNAPRINRIYTFIIFVLGIYLGAFLSGARGILLSFVLISPVILFYLINNLRLFLFTIITLTFSGLLLAKVSMMVGWEYLLFYRVKIGLETIISFKNIDGSVWQRLEMWSAALKAINSGPFFGYGIGERFSALTPYLGNSISQYTHPHNDILANTISSGFLGGIAAFIALISSFIASLLSPHWSYEKIYFGFFISCMALINANVSTVFFNDISSAWFAFSVYLIWITDFSKNKKLS